MLSPGWATSEGVVGGTFHWASWGVTPTPIPTPCRGRPPAWSCRRVEGPGGEIRHGSGHHHPVVRAGVQLSYCQMRYPPHPTRGGEGRCRARDGGLEKAASPDTPTSQTLLPPTKTQASAAVPQPYTSVLRVDVVLGFSFTPPVLRGGFAVRPRLPPPLVDHAITATISTTISTWPPTPCFVHN